MLGTNPILGDKFADEIVNHIDFDFEKLKFDVMNSFAIKSGQAKLKDATGAIHK